MCVIILGRSVNGIDVDIYCIVIGDDFDVFIVYLEVLGWSFFVGWIEVFDVVFNLIVVNFVIIFFYNNMVVLVDGV